MNTSNNIVKVGGIDIVVTRKPIKNIHLSVLPPDGKVRISAPLKTKDETIRLFISSKVSWLKNHIKTYKSQYRQTSRQYISGEEHFFLGRKYRLEVIESNEKPYIDIKRKSVLVMHIKANTSREKKAFLLETWYREKLAEEISSYVNKWQRKLNKEPRLWHIRKMKTRWGTCNKDKQRLWFNLELVKKPSNCVDYVVLHEFVHLFEIKHNKRFVSYMDKYMPNWKHYREDLNKFPLSFEKWNY